MPNNKAFLNTCAVLRKLEKIRNASNGGMFQRVFNPRQAERIVKPLMLLQGIDLLVGLNGLDVNWPHPTRSCKDFMSDDEIENATKVLRGVYDISLKMSAHAIGYRELSMQEIYVFKRALDVLELVEGDGDEFARVLSTPVTIDGMKFDSVSSALAFPREGFLSSEGLDEIVHAAGLDSDQTPGRAIEGRRIQTASSCD
jgi:hypothetical protein